MSADLRLGAALPQSAVPHRDGLGTRSDVSAAAVVGAVATSGMGLRAVAAGSAGGTAEMQVRRSGRVRAPAGGSTRRSDFAYGDELRTLVRHATSDKPAYLSHAFDESKGIADKCGSAAVCSDGVNAAHWQPDTTETLTSESAKSTAVEAAASDIVDGGGEGAALTGQKRSRTAAARLTPGDNRDDDGSTGEASELGTEYGSKSAAASGKRRDTKDHHDAAPAPAVITVAPALPCKPSHELSNAAAAAAAAAAAPAAPALAAAESAASPGTAATASNDDTGIVASAASAAGATASVPSSTSATSSGAGSSSGTSNSAAGRGDPSMPQPTRTAQATVTGKPSSMYASYPELGTVMGFDLEDLRGAEAGIAALPELVAQLRELEDERTSPSLLYTIARFRYLGPVGSARYAAERAAWVTAMSTPRAFNFSFNKPSWVSTHVSASGSGTGLNGLTGLTYSGIAGTGMGSGSSSSVPVLAARSSESASATTSAAPGPGTSASISSGSNLLSRDPHGIKFDIYAKIKAEGRRILGVGTEAGFLRKAEAILALGNKGGLLPRTRAKELFLLTDNDLKALTDGSDAAGADTAPAGGAGAGAGAGAVAGVAPQPRSKAAAAAGQKALRDFVDEHLSGFTTNGRLWAAYDNATSVELRAIAEAAPAVMKAIIDNEESELPAELFGQVVDGSATDDDIKQIFLNASDEQLRAIGRDAYAAATTRRRAAGVGKIVRYNAKDIRAACLRKYKSAAGLAAKLAANAKAAEKRAETMAIKGTAAGPTSAAASGSRRSGRPDPHEGKDLNPDGLNEWDDYIDCYKCNRRKAPLDCNSRRCKLCCIDEFCPEHGERNSLGELKAELEEDEW